MPKLEELMNRGDFLEKMLAAGSLAFLTHNSSGAELGQASSDRLGTRLLMRPFGRSGEMVTQLGVGGYHVGLPENDGVAQEIIETALAEGIRFFDMAAAYQDGRAEERYGKFLTPKYREDVFLLTKTIARSADQDAFLSFRRLRARAEY
jgi:hypothetical protein